jgi:Peptidase family M48
LTSSQRQARHRLILDLLEAFGRAFPNVTYELLWESSSINAQAWRLGSAQKVRMYGGLARYPAMTKSGLALVLAHETGHHLGGPPSDPAMPWLTWQGQADFWAASVGMPTVWGPRARSMTIKGAKEILTLHRAFAGCGEQDISAQCRRKIFEAGANGRRMPTCAEEAYASVPRMVHE